MIKHSIKPLLILLAVVFTSSIMSSVFIKTRNVNDKVESIIVGGYDLNNPATTIKLPKILHEISGLTDIDNNTIACVQDEEGIVFFYDLEKKKIKHQIKFDKDGDYEGITRVGNSLYILRSDGKLFEIDNYKRKDFQVEEYDLEIPVENNEGLAYDPEDNRLLIGGKSEPKGEKSEGTRVIFEFDLKRKKATAKPVYEFSEARIERFIDTNQANKKLKAKINPSGIAVHPKTGKLFVLSSKDHLLYIFKQNSQVEEMFRLSKKDFIQAEGITFLDNGDLWISNEGGKKDEPTLMFFPYKE